MNVLICNIILGESDVEKSQVNRLAVICFKDVTSGVLRNTIG